MRWSQKMNLKMLALPPDLSADLAPTSFCGIVIYALRNRHTRLSSASLTEWEDPVIIMESQNGVGLSRNTQGW